MKLIDKFALAAEIKKLIKRYKTFQPHSSYEDGLKEGRLIGYEDALCKINTLEVKEANYNDVFIEKACEAFCKMMCDDRPPRSTCTSLGTCLACENFVKH